MKKINIKSILLLAATMLVVLSCVKDDDFDAPNTAIVEPNIESVVSINAIVGILQQEFSQGNLFHTFEETDDYISGYVISSDEGGNFYEEIIIQDKLENPTIGIKILVDASPLFTRYELGRKVYVKLQGLTIGYVGGELDDQNQPSEGIITLAILDSFDNAQKIPESQLEEYIVRSSEKGELVPLPITLPVSDENLVNLYVTVADAQFNRNEALGDNPLTFAAEPLDQFDGERLLESCDGGSIILSTSTFADFKSVTLPVTRGPIQGVLTKDFFGEFFNLVLNFPSDIMFDSTERCDPIELDCGLASAEGTNTIFSEDFETQSTNSLVSGNGWTNFIEAGSEGWEAYSSGGTNASLGISARVGSFQSGDDSSVAWLITPAIDLDAQDNETLTFRTSNSFSDDSTMELLFSLDWDGTEANITSASWGILPQATIVDDDEFFGNWVDSGIVDLSCGTGTIYIAFKYTGSGESSFDGTYELDEINIKY